MRTVGQKKTNKNKKKEPNCLEGLTFSENCLGNVFSSVGPVSKAAVVKSREEEKRDEGRNTRTQKKKKKKLRKQNPDGGCKTHTPTDTHMHTNPAACSVMRGEQKGMRGCG